MYVGGFETYKEYFESTRVDEYLYNEWVDEDHVHWSLIPLRSLTALLNFSFNLANILIYLITGMEE